MMTLADLVRDATSRLAAAAVPSASVDAELLMAFVLELGRGEMLARQISGATLSTDQAAHYEELLMRRERREPLQHLVGRAPFMTFEVEVGPGVFVPRPETEALAQWAVAHLSTLAPGENGITVLDLCSGSGVLAITLARAVPYARVSAVEVSDQAMPYLSANVSRLAPEVQCFQASVVEFGSTFHDASVGMIVANPPYVPSTEVPNDPEVSQWDPHDALFGGAEGLDVVREIVLLASRVLVEGAPLAMEHSNLQGEQVRSILEGAGFRTVATERDLTGRERFSYGFAP